MKSQRINTILPTLKPVIKNKQNTQFQIIINKRPKQHYNSNKKTNDNAHEITSLNVRHQHEQQRQDSILNQLNSSYSLDSISNQEEKQLFWKFLQCNDLDWLDIYHQLCSLQIENPITLVKIGDDIESIESNKVISHFIGMWVISMGYNETQTKRRVTANVSFAFDQSQKTLKIAQLMYNSLFHEYLPPQLQLKALLKVCKKGWEYLTFLICRMIKLLIKKRHFIDDKVWYQKLNEAVQS